MRSLLSVFSFGLLLALPASLALPRPSAAQEASLDQQLRDAYTELDERQASLVEAMRQQSREAVAELAPGLIDASSRVLQLDSARGGALTRQGRRRIYGIRSIGHLALGDIDQAQADSRRAGREGSLDSGFHSLRFAWAYEAEDWSGVVDALAFERQMAGALEGTLLGRWEARTMAQLSREMASDEAARERFAELLVSSGWVDTVRSSDNNWVHWNLFEARADRGDERGAREALAAIDSLYSFAQILIDDRYTAYRAAIEAEHGADLAEGAADQSRRLAAEWDANREDVDYLLDYLVALRMEGRWQDIVDRFAPIVDELSSAIDAGADDHLLMNRTGFFVVNYLAHAEMMLGDVEGGLARMEKIVGLGVEARPDLINQAINRLSWLFELGRHEQALSVAREFDRVPEGIASEYAYGLIYKAAACSAHALGDEEAHGHWRDKLFALEEPSPLVLLGYHFCMADEDAAAALIIAETQGEDPTGLLLDLQDMALFEAKGPDEQAMEEMRARVVARPDVQAALADVGEIRTFALTTFYN
ncbi:MAG: hypothetical protein ABR601_08125 [Parasphingopyxis sp.]